MDLQSGEGASCAETDKQNVSLVTTSDRATILFEICTCLSPYEYCRKIFSLILIFTKLLSRVVCVSQVLCALLGKRCNLSHSSVLTVNSALKRESVKIREEYSARSHSTVHRVAKRVGQKGNGVR